MNPETLATAIRIAEALEPPTPTLTYVSRDTAPAPGRYVIVRGDRSGVFCGVLVSEDGQTVELTECRHIWYWSGAANTAEMALSGVSKPDECKFVAPVARLRVLDAVAVIDCTSDAESNLRAVPVWSKK